MEAGKERKWKERQKRRKEGRGRYEIKHPIEIYGYNPDFMYNFNKEIVSAAPCAGCEVSPERLAVALLPLS